MYWVERYREFCKDEIMSHYETFKMYDLDNSGFISSCNLQHVLAALDIEATQAQATAMINEVVALIGSSFDGKLTFRNYMDCVCYERKAQAVNDSAEAVEEIISSGVDPECAQAALNDVVERVRQLSQP